MVEKILGGKEFCPATCSRKDLFPGIVSHCPLLRHHRRQPVTWRRLPRQAAVEPAADITHCPAAARLR